MNEPALTVTGDLFEPDQPFEPSPVSASSAQSGLATRSTRTKCSVIGMSNQCIAAKLREYANQLTEQGADGFRVRAYQHAAETVSRLKQRLRDVLARDGIDGLIALPGIGKGIASAIAELIVTGRWAQLERLHGDTSPEALFLTIPGIGPELARRMAEDAHLEGPRRREAIAAVLSDRLGRVITPASEAPKRKSQPSDAMLLKVDQMYRQRAKAGTLRKIAPKRFNPTHRAWLPIMHASHGQWHFTALFSNTARAHQLAHTHDWVVIYFHGDDHAEGRCTVVTEHNGPEKGNRVVRR